MYHLLTHLIVYSDVRHRRKPFNLEMFMIMMKLNSRLVDFNFSN